MASTPTLHFSGGSQLVSTAANLTFGASTAQAVRGGDHNPAAGNIRADTRTVTFSAGSTLAPGQPGANAAFALQFTSGKLALATGSTLALDLATPTGSDRIRFVGTAADWLATAGQPTLALALGPGFDYTKTYTVIDNVTSAGFAFAAITGYDAAAYTASVAKVGNAYLLTFDPSAPPPTPFEAWTASIDWRGADSSPAAIVSPLGLANLMLYALDVADPFAADTAQLPSIGTDTATAGGPWLTFTYRENLEATDLTYTVRWSADLATWSDLTADNVTVFQDIADANPDGDHSAALIRIRMPYNPSIPHQFLRLQVTR